MYRYRVSEKNREGLYNAVMDNDIELTAAYMKDIYQEIFDNTQALSGDDLDLFTAEIDVASDSGVKELNKKLNKFYDFCDDNKISLEQDPVLPPEETDVTNEDKSESLVERELSTKERAISKIFVDNKDKINGTKTKDELISVIKDLLKDVDPARTQKIFAALASKKDYFRALQYIYDFILKGDDLGVIKEEIDVPSVEEIMSKAEKEADDVMKKLDLDESTDFDYFEDEVIDDSTDKLFPDEECDEIEDDFVADDIDSIDMISDDDGQRTPVTFTEEKTPPQFKPKSKPLTKFGLDECDKVPTRADEIDTMMDDDFEADDVDFIDIE